MTEREFDDFLPRLVELYPRLPVRSEIATSAWFKLLGRHWVTPSLAETALTRMYADRDDMVTPKPPAFGKYLSAVYRERGSTSDSQPPPWGMPEEVELRERMSGARRLLMDSRIPADHADERYIMSKIMGLYPTAEDRQAALDRIDQSMAAAARKRGMTPEDYRYHLKNLSERAGASRPNVVTKTR